MVSSGTPSIFPELPDITPAPHSAVAAITGGDGLSYEK